MKFNISKWIFIFIVCMAILVYPQSVRADVAPPKPPAGSNLDPGYETTNVRMMAETVTIDVSSVSQHDTGQASVTALFRMRNLGEIAEQMEVRFPLCSADTGFFPELDLQGYYYHFPPIENFAVWVNGIPASVNQTNENPNLHCNTHSHQPPTTTILARLKHPGYQHSLIWQPRQFLLRSVPPLLLHPFQTLGPAPQYYCLY